MNQRGIADQYCEAAADGNYSDFGLDFGMTVYDKVVEHRARGWSMGKCRGLGPRGRTGGCAGLFGMRRTLGQISNQGERRTSMNMNMYLNFDLVGSDYYS